MRLFTTNGTMVLFDSQRITLLWIYPFNWELSLHCLYLFTRRANLCPISYWSTNYTTLLRLSTPICRCPTPWSILEYIRIYFGTIPFPFKDAAPASAASPKVGKHGRSHPFDCHVCFLLSLPRRIHLVSIFSFSLFSFFSSPFFLLLPVVFCDVHTSVYVVRLSTNRCISRNVHWLFVPKESRKIDLQIIFILKRRYL